MKVESLSDYLGHIKGLKSSHNSIDYKQVAKVREIIKSNIPRVITRGTSTVLISTKPMNEGDHTISEPPKQKTLLENFLDFFTFSRQEQQKAAI
jgi:hypothetical protein